VGLTVNPGLKDDLSDGQIRRDCQAVSWTTARIYESRLTFPARGSAAPRWASLSTLTAAERSAKHAPVSVSSHYKSV